MVDGRETRQHLRPLVNGQDRAAGTLQASHRRVAVQAEDQHVAAVARGGEIANVARVKEVEAAVGEDHALTRGAQRREAGGECLDIRSELGDRHGRRA